MRFSAFLIAIGATALSAVTSAQATVMKPIEISDMVTRSTWIVRGRVKSRKAFWNKARDRIYTRVKVKVSEGYKGDIKKTESISFVTLGGKIGRHVMHVRGAPTFKQNEDVVVFLERRGIHSMVVGMTQGKFRVQEKRGVLTATRSLGCIQWHGRSPPPRTRFDMKQLQRLIKSSTKPERN